MGARIIDEDTAPRGRMTRSGFLIEELEPRILHSADLSTAVLDAPTALPVAELRVIDANGEFQAQPAQADLQARRHEVVFVDTTVPDCTKLVQDIYAQSGPERQLEVVLIDAHDDGIQRIGSTLAAMKDVSAVHVIGHGSDGQIELGASALDFESLLSNATQIKGWKQALAPGADLLLYGCDIAEHSDGRALIDALSRLTGADVAASDNLTGAAAKGGDWDLEYRTGPIEAALALSAQERASFSGVLDASAPDAASAAGSAAATPPANPAPVVDPAALPLAFEQNVGQADAAFDFLAHGSGYAVGLTGGDALLAIDNGATNQIIRLDVLDKNVAPAATGQNELQSKSNYLIGGQDQWHTDIANYGAVDYAQIYDGIDLRYYGNGRQLEYDFSVHPGADVGAIRLKFDGVQQLTLAPNGDLALTLDDAGHTIFFKAPVAYQDGPAGREAVASHYVIHQDGTVGFELDAYDATRTVVIDPTLSYGTYLGGTGTDVANGIDVDSAGNVYVAGYTKSSGILGGLLGLGGGNDAFVTKLSPTLNSVVYTTYVGGAADDVGTAIAVDASGEAYVTGYTKSAAFPTVSAYQSSLNGGQDAFVLKLNAAGDTLLYSTFLGGSGGSDTAWAIAVDSAGSAYVTGLASSADFPKTAGVVDTSYGGGEAFVTKLSSTGTSLVYSTFLGGSGPDTGYGIAVDSAGNAVVVGQTSANDFPTTANAYHASFASGTEAFVTKLNATGTAITYSTYLGQGGTTIAYNLTLDPSGKIYVTGETSSANFDVTPGALQTARAGGTDAFVSVIDPNASGAASLVYSTYLGGNKSKEAGLGIGVDSVGQIYVGGQTDSDNFAVTPDALHATRQGPNDGFVVLIDPLGTGAGDLIYGSYFGGTNADNIDNAVYSNGRFYITGDTNSNAGIATAGSYDTTYGGGTDAFVAVFTFDVPPTLTPSAVPLAYTEDAGAVTLDAGLTVADPDASLLTEASVHITGNYVSGEDLLAFNNLNTWGITGTWNAASATLTLAGSASVANYQAALRSITYQNTSEQPSTALRTVTYNATDGTQVSAAVTRQIVITSVDDQPVNTVPGAQSVNEDTPLVFSTATGNRISIGDVDAGSGAMQVSLNAMNGTLTLASTAGLTFVTGTGNGDAAMTFTGTLANINSALDGLRFDPALDFNGAASLQIVTNDQGNSGIGGPLTSTSTVAITVNPVNDAPVNSVPGPQATAQNSALVFSSGNGNAIGIGDVDAGSGVLDVTLTASNGVLTLATQLGLTSVSGDGSNALTFSGTLTSLNDALNGLTFMPSFNYGGPAGIQISVSDGGNSGAGGPASDTDFVTITVSSNVAPTVLTSGGALSYTEQAPATAVDAGLTVSDGDSPALDHAIVRIAMNHASGDVLAFTDQLGITGSWDAATATLTLTGSASAASYQAALRSVTYENPTDNPSTAVRTMSFVINDGIADSAIASRAIVVNAINDAPATSVPGAQSVDEDGVLIFSAAGGNQVTVNDPDAGSGAIQLALSSSNGVLTLAQVSGLTFVSGANGTNAMSVQGNLPDLNAALNGLSFAPAPNYNGGATIWVSANDLGNSGAGGALTSSAVIDVAVLPVNHAPAGADNTISTLEDTSYTFAVSDFGFSDAADAPPNNFNAVQITTLPALGTLTDNGVAVLASQSVSVSDIASGALRYTPAKDVNGVGVASFRFRVQDDGGTANGGVDLDSSANNMTIDVTSVNDSPVGADVSLTAYENQTYVFGTADFAFNDPNDAPVNNLLEVELVSLPGAGSLTLAGAPVAAGQMVSAIDIAAGRLCFAPAANAFGPGYASFSIALRDDGGTANGGIDLEATPHTVSFDVQETNQAPQGADATLTLLEDTSYVFAPADFGFSDTANSVPNQLLAVRIASPPGAGSLTDNGVALSAGDLVSAADIAAGKLTFAPGANASGAAYASFSFRVQDDGGTANGGIDVATAANTMTIDVTPVNDAPISADDTVTTLEDTSYVFSLADFAFADPNDGPPNNMTAVKISALPGLGSLTDNGVAVTAGQFISVADIAGGKLRFTPGSNGNGAAYTSFSFQVQDDGGTANGGANVDSAQRRMTVDVTPINDPPVLVANAGAAVAVGGNTTISDTALSVTDVDNAPSQLIYTVVGLPGVGILSLAGTPVALNSTFTQAQVSAGLLSYQHSGTSPGSDAFLFAVTDGAGGTLPMARFDITIGGAPSPAPPPVVVAPPPAAPPVVPVVSPGVVPAPPAPAPAPANPPATQPGSSTDPSTAASPASSTSSDESAERSSGTSPAYQIGAIGPANAQPVGSASAAEGRTRGGEPTRVALAASGFGASALGAVGFAGGTALVPLPSADTGMLSISSTDPAFMQLPDTVRLEAYKSALGSKAWVGQLDQLRQNVAADGETQQKIVGSTVMITGTMSVGYVIWLLRGGLLLSSLLSSLPAWHVIDPMPVLARGNRDEDEADGEDDPLEKLFSRAKAAVGLGTKDRAPAKVAESIASAPNGRDAQVPA